jgi:hypothetical protein
VYGVPGAPASRPIAARSAGVSPAPSSWSVRRSAPGCCSSAKRSWYQATLQVTDEHGRTASSYVEITVGNQPAEVDFVEPVEGQPFEFGQAVEYEVDVSDEDPIDCNRLQVHYIVGHDTHGHPQSTTVGCTGTIQTTLPTGHDPALDDISAVFVAEYTDAGGLVGSDQVVLEQPG